jgi:hypothetical protein
MSAAAKSIFVFGIYLTFLGIALIVAPNFLLEMFGIPATNEVWIRVVGMLIIYLSIYYYRFAHLELKEVYWLTVYFRSSVIVFFIAFVMLQLAKPALIIFGAIDLIGAMWTLVAMRKK